MQFSRLAPHIRSPLADKADHKTNKRKRRWCLNESTNPKPPPRPATSKAIWMGVWSETRAVHTCLSPALVNYWAGRHTSPLSPALWIIDAWCSTMVPHLARGTTPLKPGLKCGPAPFHERRACKSWWLNDPRIHTHVRTHLLHSITGGET